MKNIFLYHLKISFQENWIWKFANTTINIPSRFSKEDLSYLFLLYRNFVFEKFSNFLKFNLLENKPQIYILYY